MSSPLVYLHVGWGKTATKTLQIHMLPRLAGITYLGKHPKFVSDQVAGLMFDIAGMDGRRFDANRCRNALDAIVASWRAGERPLVLSMESLVWPDPATMADKETIARRLREVFGPASIIFTIREQIDLLRSFYVYSRMKPKNPEQRWWTFDRWLDHHLSNVDSVLIPALDFDRTIADYERLFGRESVRVFLYEDFRRNPQHFFATLCDFLGVEPHGRGLADSLPRENSSIYTDRWLAYRAVARRLGPLNPIERFIPERSMQRFFASGKKITIEVPEPLRQRVAERYRLGNRALALRHKLPLEQFGYLQ